MQDNHPAPFLSPPYPSYLPHLLGPAADLHGAALVVGAVGARDQLAVRVIAGEPPLQVELCNGFGVVVVRLCLGQSVSTL